MEYEFNGEVGMHTRLNSANQSYLSKLSVNLSNEGVFWSFEPDRTLHDTLTTLRKQAMLEQLCRMGLMIISDTGTKNFQ